LTDSGLINGQYILGRASPFAITITSKGIDTVENIIDDLIENIDNMKVNDEVKEHIKEISKEVSPKLRIRKAWST
jgi:hypothetical protein